MSRVRVPVEDLTGFAARLLEGHDVDARDAEVCATRLVEADLRGRHAHGVSRLPAYCERIRSGGLNARARVRRVRETPVSALVDGDNGLGPVVATAATEAAIDKARASGIGWVGVRGSNHAGAAGVYASLVAAEGMIGLFLAVANTNQMPPWGGVLPLLGTNPLAIAVPAGAEAPVVVDVATTVTSFGAVKAAAREGRMMPEGWMVDRQGRPLLDPARADEGFLLPIGGHKGYGLSLAIGLLAGVLNGARFGSEVVDHYHDLTTPTDTGQAVLALRVDLFRDAGEFARDVDRHLRELRSSPAQDAAAPVRVPGDGATASAADMRARGVPLDRGLLAQLEELGRERGVAPLAADT